MKISLRPAFSVVACTSSAFDVLSPSGSLWASRIVCRGMMGSPALGGRSYDPLAARRGQLGAQLAWPGVYWAGTSWGGSCRLSAGPSSPFCSDPGSGSDPGSSSRCSRACRVSACHSCTRSVGVFPAWGHQEEIWSLFRSLYQKVPSSIYQGFQPGATGNI